MPGDTQVIQHRTEDPKVPSTAPGPGPGDTDTPMCDRQYLDLLQAVTALRKYGYQAQARMVATNIMKARGDESSVWHQGGQLATAEGEFERAVAYYGQALDLLRAHGTPTTHAVQFQYSALGYGQSLMRLGRFEEGLYYYEAGRCNVSWQPWPGSALFQPCDDSLTDQPDQPGSLLVQAEGGYGDLFMCMRWLPLLKRQYHLPRVGLMVMSQSCADLCDWSGLGVDQVFVVHRDNIRFGEWKYCTSIMSLPAVFGVRGWGDIPQQPLLPWGDIPFYRTDRRTGGPFRLGVCWRAEENSSPIRTKSLPYGVACEVTDWLHAQTETEGGLFAASGLELYCLSPERADIYSKTSFAQPPRLICEYDRMQDWRTTAEYLCSMDHVLTVDTALAHLCGVLEIPCTVLLPVSSCWRWGLPGEPCRWYSPAMRLYRQQEPLHWIAEDIADQVLEDIDANAKTNPA